MPKLVRRIDESFQPMCWLSYSEYQLAGAIGNAAPDASRAGMLASVIERGSPNLERCLSFRRFVRRVVRC